MKKHNSFTVLGEPFFSLGGQTHNSSSYNRETLCDAWNAIKTFGGNTVATPVPWDAFEPEEGKFDEAFVTTLIDEARKQDLHLIFLWFATWKNGTMEYSPAWVKADPERFPRVMLKDGSVIHQLSSHAPQNLEADKKAFVHLMQVIKDYDADTQTVIGIQIENEAGILGGTRRDFGPYGQAAFEADVPQELIDYAKANPDTKLGRDYVKSGSAESGCWTKVFGRYGAEAVTAYGIATYIDSIAKAGKEVYDLFMYTNAWLNGGSRGVKSDLAGIDWPSGCCHMGNVDVYYASCKSLDVIAPDNYQPELTRHLEISRAYAKPEKGWPLYVPESSRFPMNAALMFEAIGNQHAIGYHIFGIESCLDGNGEIREDAISMFRSFQLLKSAIPLLTKYSDKKIHTVIQYLGEETQTISDFDGNWRGEVNFGSVRSEWAGRMDYKHNKDKGPGKIDWPQDNEFGRALIFQINDNEFYLVGHKVNVTFNPFEPDDGSLPTALAVPELRGVCSNLLSITEGHFDENGEYVVDVVRSGDEQRHGVWCSWDCGVIHVVLDDAAYKLQK